MIKFVFLAMLTCLSAHFNAGLSQIRFIKAVKIRQDSVTVTQNDFDGERVHSYKVKRVNGETCIKLGKKLIYFKDEVRVDTNLNRFFIQHFQIPASDYPVLHIAFLTIIVDEKGKIIYSGLRAGTGVENYDSAIVSTLKDYKGTATRRSRCNMYFYGIDFDRDIRLKQDSDDTATDYRVALLMASRWTTCGSFNSLKKYTRIQLISKDLLHGYSNCTECRSLEWQFSTESNKKLIIEEHSGFSGANEAHYSDRMTCRWEYDRPTGHINIYEGEVLRFQLLIKEISRSHLIFYLDFPGKP